MIRALQVICEKEQQDQRDPGEREKNYQYEARHTHSPISQPNPPQPIRFVCRFVRPYPMGRAEARVLLEKPMPISVRRETGYDTKHDVSRKTVWEAIEKYGRPVRARTADLHRGNWWVRKR